jgi:hypothetical protein
MTTSDHQAASKRDPINWDAAPIVYLPVVRAACPSCGAGAFQHVRGEKNGDGSSTERVVCKACEQPYKIVREPALPGSGNDESD